MTQRLYLKVATGRKAEIYILMKNKFTFVFVYTCHVMSGELKMSDNIE